MQNAVPGYLNKAPFGGRQIKPSPWLCQAPATREFLCTDHGMQTHQLFPGELQWEGSREEEPAAVPRVFRRKGPNPQARWFYPPPAAGSEGCSSGEQNKSNPNLPHAFSRAASESLLSLVKSTSDPGLKMFFSVLMSFAVGS